MNRRNFLKTIGGIGLTSIVGLPGKVNSAEYPAGFVDRLGMLTDMSLCIGCRSCEEACNKANKLPPLNPSWEDKSVFEKKRRPDEKAYTVVNRYQIKERKEPVYRKIQCMHCDSPACASACLVSALKKSKEGPIIYNPDICLGCRYCMLACPFNIPAYEYHNPLTPKVMKCFMCYERIKKGGIPACAEACPMETITFGKRDDLLKLARERIVEHPDKYVDHIYGENEVGGSGWLYISPVPFEQLDFQMDLGTTPYPEYTKNFLYAVPIIFMVIPSFLLALSQIRKEKEEVEKEEN